MRIFLIDLVVALSNAIDLVSPALTGHHLRVARISVEIAQALGLSRTEQDDIYIAGLLHDCGALSLRERLEALQFEVRNPVSHSEMGYQLLKNFRPLAKAAYYIRFHHTHWCHINSNEPAGSEVMLASHILHLADRIDALYDQRKNILAQASRITEQIVRESGRLFSPQLIDVFASLSTIEAFWLRVYYDSPFSYRKFSTMGTTLDFSEITDIAALFERVIDFRSRFTSTHSSGVAAVAEEMGRCAGLPDTDCLKLRIAGHLHDIGKLSVPAEVLEKDGRLDEEEMNLIRSHTFYTYKVLDNIRGFEDIKEFASFHHERINGSGYPFHLSGDKLSVGSRIMAVSDIFTAISEDRPYRRGMDKAAVTDILGRMSKRQDIDEGLFMLLVQNYDQINSMRISAQLKARAEYERFMESSAVHIEKGSRILSASYRPYLQQY